jgi:hypothetical protein
MFPPVRLHNDQGFRFLMTTGQDRTARPGALNHFVLGACLWNCMGSP